MADVTGFEACDQRLLCGMIDSMPCPAAAFDVSGRILYANQAAARTLQNARVQQMISAAVRSKWRGEGRLGDKAVYQNERAIRQLRELGIVLRICYAAPQYTVVCWPVPNRGSNCWSCCIGALGEQNPGRAVAQKLPSLLTAINFLESEAVLAVAALLPHLTLAEGTPISCSLQETGVRQGTQGGHVCRDAATAAASPWQDVRSERNLGKDLRTTIELVRGIATGLRMLCAELCQLQAEPTTSPSVAQRCCSCGGNGESCCAGTVAPPLMPQEFDD